MTYTVYEAVNQANGHKYIGATGRKLKVRQRRHFHTASIGRGAKFGFALRLYGFDSFIFRPLLVCPDLDYANYIERALIALYRPEYNVQAGGAGISTYSLSDEARKKISVSQKGNKHWLGKKHSEETKLKMADARTKYWAGREHHRIGYQKKGIPKRGRPVVCQGMVYESLMHAARANGLTRTNVRAAIKRKNGWLGGLRFSFVDFQVAP
jgi:group I intron endonuclease